MPSVKASTLALLYRLKARALSVPVLPSAFRRCRSFLYSLRRRQRGEVFSDIYRGNRWRDKDSRSGSGSNLPETEVLRRDLPALLASVGASTLLDAPCGDFHWMCEVVLGEVSYLGVDIVPALIERNQSQFGHTRRSFEVRDIVKGPLPAADVVMCRDCLVHLSFQEAMSALASFRASGATYLLTTTFPDRKTNYDKHTGGWRPLNLCAPPFNLPHPLQLLNEGCRASGGAYADKSLGLWRLADLDVPSP